MGWRRRIALAGGAVAAAAAAVGFRSYRLDMHAAERAWQRIAEGDRAAAERFDPAMVADLPEIGRRYFTHAIRPGTPLRRGVELGMTGTFLLGDKASHRRFAMQARQILVPGTGFVWMLRLVSGPMVVTGSDTLVGGDAWTSFWMMGLVRVADARTFPDLVRSAQFRSAVEGIWAPARLLPRNGVTWEQVGPDTARLTFERLTPKIVFEMRLAPDGAVRQVIGQRWSDANAEKQFHLQPFGRTIEAEGDFNGFTIPTKVRIGNHFGTADYLPFFQADIASARHF